MCYYLQHFNCLCTICIMPKLELCEGCCELCQQIEIEKCNNFFPYTKEFYERLTNIDNGNIELSIIEVIDIGNKKGVR